MKKNMLATFCLFACALADWKIGQSVSTTSGNVVGTGSWLEYGISQYLGIRYAESTGGPNRFMPPRRFRSNDTFATDQYSPGCPSSAKVPFYDMGEDCLTLNIYTQPQSGVPKKAVMVWMYGGGFVVGDAATPFYIGARLAANQDVVVVTINYRTNIFGFPGMPLLKDNNLGLLDQRMALEWVRDNIENFGGDKDRITIIGESAGGSSVDYYAYTWPEDPIVSGLIVQSGTAMTTTILKARTLLSDATSWYKTSTNAGCGGLSQGIDTIRCMQTRTWEQILAAIPTQEPGQPEGVTMFGPVVDEKVVFGDYYEQARLGKFMEKPLLVGSNHNESALFSFSSRFSSTPWDAAKIQAVDNLFTCAARDAARARAAHNVPVWRYHLADTRAGSHDGATHATEIPYIFDVGAMQYRMLSSLLGAASLPALGPVMQGAWAAFAKDPVGGLARYGWQRFDDEGDTLVRLGWDGKPAADFVRQGTYDATCLPPSF